jgi:hypothetical protein
MLALEKEVYREVEEFDGDEEESYGADGLVT